MMNNPEFIYIWVNPEEMSIAICACESSNKDALKVSYEHDCDIYSANLFDELRNSDKVLFQERSYRLKGVVSQGRKVARFNILDCMKLA